MLIFARAVDHHHADHVLRIVEGDQAHLKAATRHKLLLDHLRKQQQAISACMRVPDLGRGLRA